MAEPCLSGLDGRYKDQGMCRAEVAHWWRKDASKTGADKQVGSNPTTFQIISTGVQVMENKVRKKLIDAVSGLDLGDTGDEALIGLLVDKIKRLEGSLDNLRGENAHERLVLASERQKLAEEYHKLRKDPTAGMSGEVYFMDSEGKKYRFVIQGGYVRGFYKDKANDYLEQIMPVSGDTWGMK